MNKEDCKSIGGDWVSSYTKTDGTFVKGYCKHNKHKPVIYRDKKDRDKKEKTYILRFNNDGAEVGEFKARNEKEARKKAAEQLYDQWNHYSKTLNIEGEDLTRDRSEPEMYSRKHVKDYLDKYYYFE